MRAYPSSAYINCTNIVDKNTPTCILNIYVCKPVFVSNKTRDTVSNAHKMIPPAPQCFVWQSPCFALGNPKILKKEVQYGIM